MLKFVPIPALRDNYIWLLYDHSSRVGIIIDPGDAAPVIKFLTDNKINLAAILLTHHHADHVGGVPALLKTYNIPVYGPKNNQLDFITNPVDEGDQITINELQSVFNVLAIPGHTLDHIAFYDSQRLFCGDTLFLGGCGRLFEGTAAQMLNSLDKLAQLDEDTLVFCAHEYTLQNLIFAQSLEPDNQVIIDRINYVAKLRNNSEVSIPAKISVEKQTNPFLRVHDLKFKQHCEAKLQCQFADSVALFSAIRAAKDGFQFSESDYLQSYRNST